MFNNKKAQITLFILIGIVIISIYFFMNYLNTTVAEAQTDAAAQRVGQDLLQSQAVQYYAKLCLEKTTKEALWLVGLQGGNIYSYQGGMIPENIKTIQISSSIQAYPSTKVSYGIKKPLLNNYSLYPHPPNYPGKGQTSKLNFSDRGYFGINNLRKLCDINGSNRPFSISELYFNPICYYNQYTSFWSTQEQMEHFISGRMAECVNWTAIQESTGYKINQTGAVNTTVTFGTSSVFVKVSYPMELQMRGIGSTFTYANFEASFPVRIKKIAEFVAVLNSLDVERLSFNYSKYKLLGGWDEYLSVKIYSPLSFIGDYTDIIEITDSKSALDGMSYVYRFARENRIPALDLIDYNPIGEFDIIAMEYENITISPNPSGYKCSGDSCYIPIYDPDEDKLFYDYVGWKETCNEKFNFETGKVEDSCSHLQPQTSYLMKGSNENVDLRNPKKWTSSINYMSSSKNATISLEHDDIGPHNLTVYVCDAGGLCDYQIVRVMVYDVPKLYLNGSNVYDDIPDHYASIEDVYNLHAFVQHYFTNLVDLVFNDSIEGFEKKISAHEDEKKWDYYLSIPWDNFDIKTIDENSPFKKMIHLFNNPNGKLNKTHNISMTVSPSYPPAALHQVQVMQCLPHRNEEHPYPYPYNNITKDGDEVPIDPYLASHACCSNGGVMEEYIDVTTDLRDGSILVEHEFGDEVSAAIFSTQPGLFETVPVAWKNAQFLGTTENFPSYLNITLNKTFVNVSFKFPLPGTTPNTFKLQIDSTDPNYPSYGQYLGSSTKCFKGGLQYGHPYSFEETTFSLYINPETGLQYEIDQDNLNKIPDEKLKNDIIKREITRKCSDYRGNTCEGSFVDVRKVFHPCLDVGVEETCSGPDPKIKWPLTGTPLQECFNYNYNDGNKTFEQAYGLAKKTGGEANGVCNSTAKCVGNDISTGSGCHGGGCSLDLYGNSNVTTKTILHSCSLHDGKISMDSENYYCDFTNNIDYDDLDGIEDKTNYETNVYICDDNNKPDLCTAELKPLTEVQIPINDNKKEIVEACKSEGPNIDFITKGEDNVGGYASNQKDFCGDQAYEVVSENKLGEKICCDGRIDGNELLEMEGEEPLLMECVDEDLKCIDSVSPKNDNKPILNSEGYFSDTCWDEMDNDCDALTDQFDPTCIGTTGNIYNKPNDANQGKVMCGSNNNICINKMKDVLPGFFTGNSLEGMQCLQEEYTYGGAGNNKVRTGLCECGNIPEGEYTAGTIIELEIPELNQLGSKTFICIPPKANPNFLINLIISSSPTQFPEMSTGELTTTLEINFVDFKYEITAKTYPDNTNCNLNLIPNFANKKIKINNAIEKSCILKFERKNI